MDRSIGYYLDAALQYAHDVVEDRIAACKWTKAACRRQLDDLERAEHDPHCPFLWVPERAERVCRFIELLTHVKGDWAGQKIHLEPWQIFILTTVFGWYRKAGKRRFRSTYIEVPRKNAKSTLSSAVALFMLVADGESGAEVYSTATTRDQAKIVFNDARLMAAVDPDFRKRFGLRVLQHNISILQTASKFEPLSAEGSTLDGLSTHFACVDELHAHKTRAVFDVIETSMGARSQPLLWCITTAGTDQAGICYEQRNYVSGILNEVLHRHDGLGYKVKGSYHEDDTYFGIIYTIDSGYADGRADDDWTDPATWAKANPNLGVSVGRDDIKRLADKAIKVASARANFLTKRLNVWVNAASAWMDMRKWDAAGDPTLKLEDFRGAECWISLDLASKKDVCEKMRVFRRPVGAVDHYYAFATHYLPEDAATDEVNSQYAGWVEDGWLKTTPGNVTDYNVLKEDLREDMKLFSVQEVPFDPWQATQLSTEMLEEGAPMVELRNIVAKMTEPMKEFEALVLQGRFHHNGDPVLTWMVANVVAKEDKKGNIFPVKETEAKKIDGAVAIIMALARAITAESNIVRGYEVMVL